MHIDWNAIQLVLAVAESGSLSGAARTLATTQPTISRRLAELEAQIGEPLFVREVRGARLTSFGERFVEPARRMADAGADVARIASGADKDPRGVVRITAPPGIAFALLAPLAATLRTELPEIQLEVLSTVRYLDLVRREADLAIRLVTAARRETQRDLVVLAQVSHPVVAYAAPRYRASLPKRYGFADVAWIAWPPPFDDLPPNPQLAARIPSFRPAFAADDFLVQLRAAEAGLGAIILSRFLPPKTLVPLDLELGKLTASHQLVCARASLTIPRVHAIATRLAAELKRAK